MNEEKRLKEIEAAFLREQIDRCRSLIIRSVERIIELGHPGDDPYRDELYWSLTELIDDYHADIRKLEIKEAKLKDKLAKLLSEP